MAITIFKPGDVVQLKSGTVKMTVKSVNADNVDCSWHDSQNKVVEHVYAASMLELVPKHKPKPKPKPKPTDWKKKPGDV